MQKIERDLVWLLEIRCLQILKFEAPKDSQPFGSTRTSTSPSSDNPSRKTPIQTLAKVVPETPLQPAWADVGKGANQTLVYVDAHANSPGLGMLCHTAKVKYSAAGEIEIFEGAVGHKEHQQIRFSQHLLERMELDGGVI